MSNSIIPDEISIYFEEVASRLKKGHASIMIGAGFSKNATPNNNTAKKFPSWSELGDIFMERLHPNSTEKNTSYVNVLKLADEVEATFGKSYLNNLILTEIPDNDYSPSDLHISLLSLPWNDVFTTNYDTLLERTADKIIKKKFDIVDACHKLVWSKSPRIVKLHGSFPSQTPFVVSGEDYRKYPQDYAPFVNTVQQSLLENTLCLVGFSGDDPNFLNWIGWIRDNLGENNSPKIYLIGILKLSNGERRLLESRNIIPVDLSALAPDSNDHSDALRIFVEQLKKYVGDKEVGDWRSDSHKSIKKDNIQGYRKLISLWSRQRDLYPKMLILNESRRTTLLFNTKNIIPSTEEFNKLGEPQDICLLYEYNWRMETALFPIMSNNDLDIYEHIVNKYNPFEQTDNETSSVNIKTHPELDWRDISRKWLALSFALLRVYREDGVVEKWEKCQEQLQKVKDNFTKEELATYNYECCLFYKACFNHRLLHDTLSAWESDPSMLYWEAKRIMLLFEVYNDANTPALLTDLLAKVRVDIRDKADTVDISLLSIEAYLMYLHRHVLDKTFSLNVENRKEYWNRWRELEKYNCNPLAEINLFKYKMQSFESFKKTEEETPSFDVGLVNTTYNWGNANNEPFHLAYSYFKFADNIGLPYSFMDKDSFGKALSVLSIYSTFTAISAISCYGNNDLADVVFSRKYIVFMDNAYINKTGSMLIATLKYLASISDNEQSTPINKGICQSLPEVISRLCCKLSYDLRFELLEVIKENFITLTEKSVFNNISHLIQRLIRSFTLKEQYKLLPTLLEIPIGTNEKYNPFIYLSANKDVVRDSVDVTTSVIEKLIENLSQKNEIRSISFRRLDTLNDYGLLNKEQVNAVAMKLWEKTGSDNFPIMNRYYHHYVVNKFTPEGVDSIELFRTYINSTPFKIVGPDKGTTISYGEDISIFLDIAGTADFSDRYEWTPDEINNLIDNICKWWDSDKNYLTDDTKSSPFGFSVSNEFRKRHSQIENIICNVIPPNIGNVSKENKDRLFAMINEIPNFDLGNLQIKVSLPSLFTDRLLVDQEITRALSHKNRFFVLDATNAIMTLLDTKEQGFQATIKALASNFRCGKREGLNYTISGVSYAILKNSDYIDSDILSDINLGLYYMLDTQCYEGNDTKDIIKTKLNTRVDLAKLIARLKLSNFDFDYSDVITKWEEQVLYSDKEFLEVKNEYINTIDTHNDES